MVKSLAAAATVLVSLASVAQAFNYCKPGITYCGSSLVKKNPGDTDYYVNKIYDALKAAHHRQDYHTFYHSLFRCHENNDGGIEYRYICDGDCRDNGVGQSDSC